jgi:hypothetical protein
MKKMYKIGQNILSCGKLCNFIARYGGFIDWKYTGSPRVPSSFRVHTVSFLECVTWILR